MSLNLPQSNICIIEIPERENREEVIFEELISVNFPELVNDLKPLLKVTTSADQNE